MAVGFVEDLPDASTAVGESLRQVLARGVAVGTGLYVVSADGSLLAQIGPRPVPAAPLAAPVGPVDQRPPFLASGDVETGRLISVRSRSPAPGWTVVAERYLTVRELAEGARGPYGMLALTGLGLVAAAAFAHAARAGLARSTRAADEPAWANGGEPRRPLIRRAADPGRTPRAAPPETDAHPGEREPVPSGNSIVRLREALGASAEGPDIAAGARSPLLRALSKHVRSPVGVRLPAEVLEWGRRAAASAGPAPEVRRSA